MARAFVLLMDSFGIGAASDATAFGDAGADTFGHIAAACALGRVPGRGVLHLPNLERLGLTHAHAHSVGGLPAPGFSLARRPEAAWGSADEISKDKDTPSGHWEIAGVPVPFRWGHFKPEFPSFPPNIVDALVKEAGLTGILGNRAGSGTEIIAELGAEHLRTGMPICYTSGDSVFQIAAHEGRFGLERLHAVCKIARRLVDPLSIGRVIARPFEGAPGAFRRTGRRKDYAMPPPAPTLLERLSNAGRPIISIGKTADIFAHQGTGEEVKADGNMALFDATVDAARRLADGGLAFANFVDFDMLYGHRRDVAGYANALEAFDARLPELGAVLRAGDVVVITADHGCDPTWRGTDHTRERIPVLAYGPGVQPGPIGRRNSFADIGQSLAGRLGIAPLPHGSAAF